MSNSKRRRSTWGRRQSLFKKYSQSFEEEEKDEGSNNSYESIEIIQPKE